MEVCSTILHRFAPQVNFTCDEHVEWGFVFTTKPIINTFFNNMAKVINESDQKDHVAQFKKTKRQKSH